MWHLKKILKTLLIFFIGNCWLSIIIIIFIIIMSCSIKGGKNKIMWEKRELFFDTRKERIINDGLWSKKGLVVKSAWELCYCSHFLCPICLLFRKFNFVVVMPNAITVHICCVMCKKICHSNTWASQFSFKVSSKVKEKENDRKKNGRKKKKLKPVMVLRRWILFFLFIIFMFCYVSIFI